MLLFPALTFLKEFLLNHGYNFVSDTDTEVVAHLFDYYYNGDMLNTAIKMLTKLDGSYALGIISKDNPDRMIAVRKDSPLIVGLSDEGNFIASDIPAVLPYTRQIYLLEDNEIVELKKDSVTVYDIDKTVVEKSIFEIDWDISAAEKCGYEHFMFKEIMEQPKAIHDTLSPRIINGKIVFEELKLTDKYIKNMIK